MLRWLPENVSTYGPDIDRLFYVIYYVTGATFFVVQITLLVFLVLYRHQDGRRATYTHGNTSLEIAWTIAPAILLVILAFVSRKTWADIKQHIPPSDMVIQVTAKQFNWEVAYPGPDGKFDTDDDVVMDNDVHVPVNKTIRVLVKSRDVIHSFFIPSARFKQDAVPGHSIPTWFKITRTGKYEIPCAELCGFGHSGMRGWLYVQTPEEYEAWARENKVGPLLTAPALGNGGTPRQERRDHPRRSAPRRRPSRGRLHPPLHLLDRPQDDRQAVPDPRAPRPDDGRPPRPAGPLGARLAGEQLPQRRPGAGLRVGVDGQPASPRRQHHAGRLQRLLHHARDHHDLLRGHADPGRVLRKLPDPAHDRRARHGLPGAQYAVVLGRRDVRGPHA